MKNFKTTLTEKLAEPTKTVNEDLTHLPMAATAAAAGVAAVYGGIKLGDAGEHLVNKVKAKYAEYTAKKKAAK